MILNMAGGGSSLNFAVVGGTARPSSPKENTIWVNTSTKINTYAISYAEPESPAAGDVWFATRMLSPAPFEAVKKSGIWAYPADCRQYIGGQWVWTPAEVYQNGAWIPLQLTLIDNGVLHDEYKLVGGGCTAYNQMADHFTLDGTVNGYHGFMFATPIDLTPYKEIETCSYYGMVGPAEACCLKAWSNVSISDPRNSTLASVTLTSNGVSAEPTVLDVSGINQVCLVGIQWAATWDVFVKSFILR